MSIYIAARIRVKKRKRKVSLIHCDLILSETSKCKERGVRWSHEMT
jgi:hypothetical protein